MFVLGFSKKNRQIFKKSGNNFSKSIFSMKNQYFLVRFFFHQDSAHLEVKVLKTTGLHNFAVPGMSRISENVTYVAFFAQRFI